MRARYLGLIMLVVIGVLPIGIAGIIMVRRAEKTSLEQAQEANQRVAERSLNQLNQYVDGQIDTLRTIGDAINPAAALKPEQVQAVLRGYSLTFPHLRKLDVVGLDCMELATLRLDGGLRSRCREDEFEVAKKDGVFLGPVVIARDRAPVMTFGVRLEIAHEPIGVVIAEVDMVAIWGVVHDIKVGATGRARLIAKDGTLLAHGDPEQRGRIFVQDKDPTLAAVKAVPAGTGVRMRDSRGRDVLAVHADLPRTGWTLVVEQPVSEAFAAAAAMRRDLAIVIAVALVLVVLVGILVGKGPVRVLEVMRGHAQRIGKGDLAARIELPKVAELRALAVALNDMAGDLDKLQDDMRKNERLQTFAGVAAGLAHDLRLPIESAMNAVTWAADNPTHKEAQATLRRALENDLLRIQRYIADLQRLAKEGKVATFVETIDPRELAEKVVASARAHPRWMDVQFAVTGAGAKVLVDRSLVERALFNMVSNAADVTCGQGGNVTLEVSDADEGQMVVFAVRDTGPGIKPERLAEVMGGNFRSDKRTVGIGLGLGVVRQVAKAHEGQLVAESELGKGSVFSLRLRRPPPVLTGLEDGHPGGAEHGQRERQQSAG